MMKIEITNKIHDKKLSVAKTKNMSDELIKKLICYKEKLEYEINYFRQNVQNNLKYVSKFERYIEENRDVIKTNPELIEKAYFSFHSYFPYILNNSLLITLDSYFDYKFYLLVELLSIPGSSKIDNTNGTCIYKCFRYLNKNLNISISKKNTNWILIENLHQIRNLIVHCNSKLISGYHDKLTIDNFMEIKNHKNYKQIISLKEFIDIDEMSGKFYIFNDSIFVNYLDSIEFFIKDIITDVKMSLDAK